VRCFLAVDVKDEKVLTNIEKVQRKLEDSGSELKLVSKENLHFTLKFLGEVEEERIKDIIRVLKDVEFSKFKSTYKGMGVFPNFFRINVIWVGVDLVSEVKFKELNFILEEKLYNLGFPKDRSFVPHLTISRVKSNKNKDKLVSIIREYEDYEFGSEEVKSFVLKKSLLTPKGPIYSNLAEFPLKYE